MCGIAGIVSLSGKPVSEESLRQMARALSHRGPDGEGVWLGCGGRVGLAHRRLAILDLRPEADQPFHSRDGRHIIVYNGEIYNHLELRKKLAGFPWLTTCDTETLLELFAGGETSLDDHNGIFAFAVCDTATGQVTLARDRLGVKPLLYAQTEDYFFFASEAKAFLFLDGIAPARELEPAMLSQYLRWGALLRDERTFFKNVKQLPGGCLLEVSPGEVGSPRRYWNISREEFRSRYDYANPAETLKSLFRSSVEMQLEADVPVGTCLSGGLDSSTLVKEIGALGKRGLMSFTCGYDEDGHDERWAAKMVARSCGLYAHLLEPDGRDFLPVLEKIAWHQETPTGGPGLYSQWKVMEEAHGKVKVLLDGQGGDELFTGYFPYIRRVLFSHLYCAARGSVKHLLAFFRENSLADKNSAITFAAVLGKVADRLGFDRKKRWEHESALDPRRIFPVIGENALPESPSYDARVPIDRLAFQQVFHDSLPPLLHYEDANAMAFGIEARVPFLDHRLVEFALGLPFDLKYRNGWTKWILRDTLAAGLPDEIRWRRDKLGYPTPFGNWLGKYLAEEVRDLFASRKFRERGWYDCAAVDALLADQLAGRKDEAWALYRILSLEFWARAFLDR
jgi:asparagine synthase (glutamine-hydrolysing)